MVSVLTFARNTGENNMTDIPPEYQGSKTGVTRTFRDICTTQQEFEDYVKEKQKKAVEKFLEERMKEYRQYLLRVLFYFISAPLFTYAMEWLLTGNIPFIHR